MESLKGCQSLAAVTRGTRGRIAFLGMGNDRNVHKLMSMGILPGSCIELIQKFPSFVLQLGHSQVAMDEELAREIFIRPGS